MTEVEATLRQKHDLQIVAYTFIATVRLSAPLVAPWWIGRWSRNHPECGGLHFTFCLPGPLFMLSLSLSSW